MPDPSSDSPAEVEDAVRAAAARERHRLADRLHQTASQSLTAAYYAALVLARQSPESSPGHAADLAALPDLIHTAIAELREITREFREPGEQMPPP